MRPLLKYGVPEYGVPAAAGLATGGYALSQGEDPGSAALAAGLGGLGAAGGLLASRKLAGKFAPQMVKKISNLGEEAQDILLTQATKMREGGLRQKALLDLAEVASGAGSVPGATQSTQRVIGRNMAAALVPASALTAGLGGVAAGAVPGALGVPGFQQAIDPEMPGSSNTQGARMSMQTYPGMY